MIRLNNLSLDFAGNIIFKNISLQIKKADKIGLIGNNGSGKTTFLNLLSEKNNPTTGDISKDENTRIGYLPQELKFKSNSTLKEFVIGSNDDLKIIQNKINHINDLLSSEKSETKLFKLLEDLEKLQFEKDKINLLNLEINAEKVMKGLGFKDEDFVKNINDFSGGWKMRAELSRILILNPDILLLDEPTNHLDLPAIIWLEKFLNSTNCAIVLVSHDIQFLDKNVNRIFDVTQKSIKDFKGKYSQYINHREKEIERQVREKKNQDKYVKQANLLINKFRYKKNKAAFAQTLIKRLEKMDKIEIDQVDISSISFNFPDPLHCGQIVFQSNNLKKSYGNKLIFENLSLDIYKGDRIAFVGKNGCGKTTLTKIINGEIDFDGNTKKGEKVIINYFAQNQNDLLNPEDTIIDHVKSIDSEKTESELRGLLGSFLFSGDAIYKKTKVLSGGEKARLCLCALLLSPSNVIILDEPTNHLDIFAKDILKQALMQYKGTLIVVSHDRDFLSGLTDKIIEFDERRVREFPGNIEAYLDSQDIEFIKPVKKKKKNNQYQKKKEIDKKLRYLNKKNTKIEKEIAKIEKEIKEFNKLLNGEYQDGNEIDYNDYNRLEELLNAQLEDWEKNQEEINEISERSTK
tara:strand:- start:129 stop:2024 length:1896 start_codon:yes stop_codon:yes gene_type:complete